MNLTGNTILITGGATGIGLALAKRFSNEGNQVIICGRGEATLQKAKAEEAFIEDDSEAKKKDDELNQQHDMRESISHMDKDALKQFAQTQWRISLDGRKSVEALRADVIQKFDQFGSV